MNFLAPVGSKRLHFERGESSTSSDSKKPKIQAAEESLKVAAAAFSPPPSILQRSIVVHQDLDSLCGIKEKEKEKEEEEQFVSLYEVRDKLKQCMKDMSIKKRFKLLDSLQIKEIYFLALTLLLKKAHKPSHRHENISETLLQHYLDRIIESVEEGFVDRDALINSGLLEAISLTSEQKQKLRLSDLTEQFPAEILCYIFSFCTVNTIFSNIMGVNKKWRVLAAHDSRVKGFIESFLTKKMRNDFRQNLYFSFKSLLMLTKLSENKLIKEIKPFFTNKSTPKLFLRLLAQITILQHLFRPNSGSGFDSFRFICMFCSKEFNYNIYTFALLFANKNYFFNNLLEDFQFKVYTPKELAKKRFAYYKQFNKENRKIEEEELIHKIQEVRKERFESLMHIFFEHYYYSSRRDHIEIENTSEFKEILFKIGVVAEDKMKLSYFKIFFYINGKDFDYSPILYSFSKPEVFITELLKDKALITHLSTRKWFIQNPKLFNYLKGCCSDLRNFFFVKLLINFWIEDDIDEFLRSLPLPMCEDLLLHLCELKENLEDINLEKLKNKLITIICK